MTKKIPTIKIILATLGIFTALLPIIALAGPTDPAVPPSGGTGGSGTPQAGSVKPEDLFYPFTYTNVKSISGTNIGAVNAIVTTNSWQTVLANIIKMLLNISGGLALVAFTVAGVVMVTARGKPDVFEKGKKLIIAALAGLIIISISYALVIGVSSLQFFTPGAGSGTPNAAGTPAAPAPGTPPAKAPAEGTTKP